MKNLRKILSIGLMVISHVLLAQKQQGLALTPPMGWNSWNYFSCNVSEQLIRETADAMVSSGMKDAGYEYINIDDCWHGERDADGNIQPDPERFPSGMKALADYVHSKGLKLGIYSDAGWQTCAGRPGSRGYEYQDAQQYANWGIDYLKYDWCNTEGLNQKGAYLTMRNALYKTGRPIVFSICEWGDGQPWEWASDIGHLWRTTGDIYHCFDCVIDHGSWKQWGVLQVLDLRDNNVLRKVAGPGHWNDPDMMEVGNGMTLAEDRAHFSMWSMLSAPLIAGNDIRNMSKDVRDILTNEEVIAINQDPKGVQGFNYYSSEGIQLWLKPLENGDIAACFLNRNADSQTLNFHWDKYYVNDNISNTLIDFKNEEYLLRNVWSHKAAGSTKQTLKAEIGGHDVLMYRLSKQ
jgi:alpha-galactosidase